MSTWRAHRRIRETLVVLTRSAGRTIQALHLYGAAGIAVFGWAVCRIIGADSGRWAPHWIAAALLFYNIDRLRHDPSDSINTPGREAWARKVRGWSRALCILSGLVLLGLPTARRDWTTLAATLLGGAICLNYSVPYRGFRLKNVPLLKTFFAPGLVVAAVLGLPLLHKTVFWNSRTALLAAWSFTALFFNMMLCDLRDIPGDTLCGVASVPARLGASRARAALAWLLALNTGLGLWLAIGRAGAVTNLAAMAAGVAFYLALLLSAVRRPQSEGFYEWWVEGILFVPGVCLIFVGS